MPGLPQPLKIIDWKKKAILFDSLVFSFNNNASYGSLIWLDSSRRNIDQVTYGLYTVIGDVRQGPGKNNGEFHEALTSLNSLVSAGLLGIATASGTARRWHLPPVAGEPLLAAVWSTPRA